MKITDIDEMEKIVAKNPNLSWDGWDVVHHVQDDYAEYNMFGSFNKNLGKWFKTVRYSCDEGGWDIPNSVIS